MRSENAFHISKRELRMKIIFFLFSCFSSDGIGKWNFKLISEIKIDAIPNYFQFSNYILSMEST